MASKPSDLTSTGPALQDNGASVPKRTGQPDVSGRGVMRPLPVHSLFGSSLPITNAEIHMVLAALGPDLAAIFDEEP